MILDPGNKKLLALPRWLADRLERDAMSLGMNPAVVVYSMLETMTQEDWEYIFVHKHRYANAYAGQEKQE